MTYVVDFESATNIGDARYWLVRLGGKTSVFRQWLKGKQPDPCCHKEILAPSEITKQLMGMYNILQSGGMPAVA